MRDVGRVGLATKFIIIFAGMIAVILMLVGIITYNGQMRIYKQQCETNIRDIGEYLELMMEADSSKTVIYQEAYMKYFDEIDIPYDFDNFYEAMARFRSDFAKEFPGKELDVDVELTEMPEYLIKEWLIYMQEYWLLTFEQARDAFDIPYTYYLVPKEEIHDVVYMIDGERTMRKDDNSLLYLGDEYYNDPSVYKILWKTWDTGKKQNGYQEWNNAWGHTYSYYTPVTINGETLGIIGTEIAVEKVNNEILNNTISILIRIAIALIVVMVIMLVIINRMYISKLEKLESAVINYAQTKDSSITSGLSNVVRSNDEIGSLARQFSSMTVEMDNYIRNLIDTTKQLKSSKQREQDMSELANRDALTGIRNRNAYNVLEQELTKEIERGGAQFGIVMADLNCLKFINDTYGHDKGNIAINALCRMVCDVFAHSPVFRVGGDEFVIVLKRNDYDHADELIDKINTQMEDLARDDALDPWEKVSAAVGFAKYDPKKDRDVDSVLKRADESMYKRKQEMKCQKKQEI